MRKYSVTEWWPYTDVTTCAPSFFLGIHTFLPSSFSFRSVDREYKFLPLKDKSGGKTQKFWEKERWLQLKTTCCCELQEKKDSGCLGWIDPCDTRNRTEPTWLPHHVRTDCVRELNYLTFSILSIADIIWSIWQRIYFFPMINGKQMTALREPERVGIPFISLSIPSLGMRQTNETMQPTWIYYSISLLSFHSIQNSIRIFQEFKKINFYLLLGDLVFSGNVAILKRDL